MINVSQTISNQQLAINYAQELSSTLRGAKEHNSRLAYLGLISLVEGRAITNSIDNYPDETFPDPRSEPEHPNPNAPTISIYRPLDDLLLRFVDRIFCSTFPDACM
ncbi:MAG: hypothetical protein ABH859_08240 [Pseudomonadota bacterium]